LVEVALLDVAFATMPALSRFLVGVQLMTFLLLLLTFSLGRLAFNNPTIDLFGFQHRSDD